MRSEETSSANLRSKRANVRPRRADLGPEDEGNHLRSESDHFRPEWLEMVNGSTGLGPLQKSDRRSLYISCLNDPELEEPWHLPHNSRLGLG